jgi:hypothetical protein
VDAAADEGFLVHRQRHLDAAPRQAKGFPGSQVLAACARGDDAADLPLRRR